MEEIFSCLWMKTWARPIACHPLLGDSLWLPPSCSYNLNVEVGIVGSLTACSHLGQFGSALGWKLQGWCAVSLCCLYFPNSSLPPTTPKRVCFTSCHIEMGNSYQSESRGSFKRALAFVDFLCMWVLWRLPAGPLSPAAPLPQADTSALSQASLAASCSAPGAPGCPAAVLVTPPGGAPGQDSGEPAPPDPGLPPLGAQVRD